jgi:hypothetical protein
LLQPLQKLFAGHTSLVGAGHACALGICEQVRGEELLNGCAHFASQPTALEIVDLVVELLALFLEYNAIGVAVQLLVRQLGCVLGVYLAKGSLDGRPRVVKVDLIAVQALCLSHGQLRPCMYSRALARAVRPWPCPGGMK